MRYSRTRNEVAEGSPKDLMMKHPILKASTRRSVLKERHDRKMARSAQTYVRGTTKAFYEWLTSDMGGLVPMGPPVWICGDCHLGNLGPVANLSGQVEI